MRVLIVDDNARIRSVIRGILGSAFHDVHEASNGAEAVDAYARLRPECVLMDVEMRPEDGLSATRRIRESDPDARIIIVTEYDDDEVRRAAERAGAAAFMSKEDLPRLLDIIARRDQ